MSVKIEIKGLDKIVDMADKYPAVSMKHINDAIKTSIFSIQKGVVRTAPIGITRMLKNNWANGTSFSPFYGQLQNLANNKGFYYANALEFGTKRITPRFYLQNAVNEKQDIIDKAFDVALTKIINEI